MTASRPVINRPLDSKSTPAIVSVATPPHSYTPSTVSSIVGDKVTTASSAVRVPNATPKETPPSTHGLPLTRTPRFHLPATGVMNSRAYVPSWWSTMLTARADAPPGPSSASCAASSPSKRKFPY